MVAYLDKNKIYKKYSKIIPPWGPIGYIVYKRTYSRLLEGENRTEEWHETLFRCVNGLQEIGCNFTEDELYEFYDHLFFMRGMLSGRAMWQLGTRLSKERYGDSLCNCFASETKILTVKGWEKIGDCEGSYKTLLSKDGKFITSYIKNFGKQKLYKLIYRINKHRYTVYSTADHLWYTKNGKNEELKKTIDLRKNDLFPTIYKDRTEYVAEFVSIQPTDRDEDVFCAVVPKYHSFVIDGNVLTHNCWSISLDNTDAFQFIFEELMLGGGVGYNITFEKVYSLPIVRKVDYIRREDCNDAVFYCTRFKSWMDFIIKKNNEIFF